MTPTETSQKGEKMGSLIWDGVSSTLLQESEFTHITHTITYHIILITGNINCMDNNTSLLLNMTKSNFCANFNITLTHTSYWKLLILPYATMHKVHIMLHAKWSPVAWRAVHVTTTTYIRARVQHTKQTIYTNAGCISMINKNDEY